MTCAQLYSLNNLVASSAFVVEQWARNDARFYIIIIINNFCFDCISLQTRTSFAAWMELTDINACGRSCSKCSLEWEKPWKTNSNYYVILFQWSSRSLLSSTHHRLVNWQLTKLVFVCRKTMLPLTNYPICVCSFTNDVATASIPFHFQYKKQETHMHLV